MGISMLVVMLFCIGPLDGVLEAQSPYLALFNITVSLTLLALLSPYMISIGCVLRKRLLGEPLPPARLSLGRFGIPINMFAFFYCGFVMVFACFPAELPVDTSSANWAPAVWAGVLVLSGIIYVVQ